MATKTKALPKKPVTVVGQIGELVDKHIDTVEAIIQEYSWLSDVGMDTELRAANEKLKEFSAGLEEPDSGQSFSFSELLDMVEAHKDFDADDVLNIVSLSNTDLLESMDTDEIKDYLKDRGYCFIDLQGNQDNSDKLEKFITTEIYPHYNDQQAFF